MIDLAQALAALEATAQADLASASDVATLEAVRVRWFGRKGSLATILRGLGEMDAAERPAAGKLVREYLAALQAAGLKFAFHPHGYEFHPISGGHGETPFDLLVELTRPGVVSFEMDVFWVAHAGIDPAALLAKYPDRWTLLHVKDLRRGAAITGTLSWTIAALVARKLGRMPYQIA